MQPSLRASLCVAHVGRAGGVGGDIFLAGGGGREGADGGGGLRLAQRIGRRPQRTGDGVSRGHGGRAMGVDRAALCFREL